MSIIVSAQARLNITVDCWVFFRLSRSEVATHILVAKVPHQTPFLTSLSTGLEERQNRRRSSSFSVHFLYFYGFQQPRIFLTVWNLHMGPLTLASICNGTKQSNTAYLASQKIQFCTTLGIRPVTWRVNIMHTRPQRLHIAVSDSLLYRPTFSWPKKKGVLLRTIPKNREFGKKCRILQNPGW